ncbi:MAG TPA: V-type ATPase subunit [Gemmatimonadaceae bacterium]
MTVWVDVTARARGLAGRLLSVRRLTELAQSRDLHELATRLAALRNLPAPQDTIHDARELEIAERRRAGGQIRLLGQWAGARAGLLAPLFEDEDCRAIRAAIRGAAAGTPAVERLSGLLPTPALPQRALTQLVSSRNPAAVAALLVAFGNPYGPPLLVETSRQHPELFILEHVLAHTWVDRARRAAARAGRAMRVYVERQIDLANCWSALLVAEHGFDGSVDDLFLDGGRLLPRDVFRLATQSRSRTGARALLDELVRQSPLAAATSRDPGAEERLRRALWREQRDIARLDPTGPAVIIEYWLRLRGEVEAVQRLIWGIAAAAPMETRTLVDS